jgi:hypothetical protein
MRIFGLAALVAAALASGGCLVLALNPIYDGQTIEFDEALVGTWDRAEDGSSVVIGRGPWRSYDLAYTAGDTTLKLTAYATRIGEARFLDVAPQHGVDLVPLAVPMHAVVRFQLVGDTLTVSWFDYEWWMRAAAQGALRKLGPAVDGRRNLVLASPEPALREWIASALRTSEAYDDAVTLTRRR